MLRVRSESVLLLRLSLKGIGSMFKKILKMVISPHIALAILLFAVSAVFLPYAMLRLDGEPFWQTSAYVLSAYTLTVWCVKAPSVIRFFKKLRSSNRYVKRWIDDGHLRIKVSLVLSFLWNFSYAVLQAVLGIKSGSAWYYSLAVYYISLAIMRFMLARYTLRYSSGENMKLELVLYRVCGAVFFVMNVALSVITVHTVYFGRASEHGAVITIALATYTFFTFTKSLLNVVNSRKFHSPVHSASRLISLSAACVSMLTLESAMLVTFDSGDMTETTRRAFLLSSSIAILVFIIITAVYMIVGSGKKLKEFTANEKKYETL